MKTTLTGTVQSYENGPFPALRGAPNPEAAGSLLPAARPAKRHPHAPVHRPGNTRNRHIDIDNKPSQISRLNARVSRIGSSFVPLHPGTQGAFQHQDGYQSCPAISEQRSTNLPPLGWIIDVPLHDLGLSGQIFMHPLTSYDLDHVDGKGAAEPA